LPLTRVKVWASHPEIAVFDPSAKKATVPPPSLGLIVAVKVTACPVAEGFGELVTVVVVFAALTVCPSLTEPLLVAKPLSPE
jgi:hypothetical protein